MNLFYPVNLFADWLVYRFFDLSPETVFAGALHFFVYDTIKIFILLVVIIFSVSIIRSFLPPERVRDVLVRKGRFIGTAFAALFGIVTPFCTCSAVPLFLGFIEAGVPLGTTFAFLVSSPMINEVALVMLLGLFGPRIALIYVASGLVIAIASGMLISALRLEHLVKRLNISVAACACGEAPPPWKDRLRYAREYTTGIIRSVWPYVLVGIGLGAWIHGYVPADFLAKYAGRNTWYAVPLATLIGIPLYSNAAGVIPLVSALTEKGVAMGTTLAFMMAVTGLSLPEFMILKRVMKTKLILIFASIVGVGIVFTGYLFNLVLK